MKTLYVRYLNDECSPEEINFLLHQFSLSENEEVLKELIRQQLESGDAGIKDQEEWKEKLAVTYRKVLKYIQEERQGAEVPTVPMVPMVRRKPFWFAAAAILLLVVSSAAYFYSHRQKEQELAGTQASKPTLHHDVAPGGNRAVLVLADGSKVLLDSAGNGALALQGLTKVVKQADGQLAYEAADGGDSRILYNTIATPRGGQYRVVLPDGSKVWLNAASSLRFPTAFVGAERKVEMSGEAYFEVAHNAEKPFYVSVNGMDVQVLGTHFNINSYEDESTVNTTLLQGSVRVAKASNSVFLKPGQQSRLEESGAINVWNDVDVEEVMAWKNGRFQFGEAMDIKMIMRQLVRWYDIEVEYKGPVAGRIGGTISRDVTISKVLEMLEMTGAVRFNVQGRKVVVMPK